MGKLLTVLSTLGITISSGLNVQTSSAPKPKSLLDSCSSSFIDVHADMNIIRKLYIAIIRLHLEYASQFGIISILKDQQTLENTCRVCLKRWELTSNVQGSHILTLAARRKLLKLCTYFSYVNRLSIAH